MEYKQVNLKETSNKQFRSTVEINFISVDYNISYYTNSLDNLY